MGRPIFFNNKLDGDIGFYDLSDLASLNINLDKVPPWLIYVFGSNRKGIHGAGAALYARNNFGARIGQGAGFQGQSYGIPTKNDPKQKGLPLNQIAEEVDQFCEFTQEYREFNFIVTAIGTGFAGHEHKDIAPMFNAATNCWFTVLWSRYMYKF